MSSEGPEEEIHGFTVGTGEPPHVDVWTGDNGRDASDTDFDDQDLLFPESAEIKEEPLSPAENPEVDGVEFDHTKPSVPGENGDPSDSKEEESIDVKSHPPPAVQSRVSRRPDALTAMKMFRKPPKEELVRLNSSISRGRGRPKKARKAPKPVKLAPDGSPVKVYKTEWYAKNRERVIEREKQRYREKKARLEKEQQGIFDGDKPAEFSGAPEVKVKRGPGRPKKIDNGLRSEILLIGSKMKITGIRAATRGKGMGLRGRGRPRGRPRKVDVPLDSYRNDDSFRYQNHYDSPPENVYLNHTTKKYPKNGSEDSTIYLSDGGSAIPVIKMDDSVSLPPVVEEGGLGAVYGDSFSILGLPT